MSDTDTPVTGFKAFEDRATMVDGFVVIVATSGGGMSHVPLTVEVSHER